MIETNKIYLADCLGENGLCNIPDKSINMILCDLPYGQTSNEWDKKLDLSLLWEQWERITVDNAPIVLTCKDDFMFELYSSNPKLYRYRWVWDKDKGANFAHVRYRPLNVHEDVLIFYKKTPTYNPQMTEGKPYKQKRENKNIEGIADNLKRYTTESDGKRYPKSIIRVNGMAQRHIIYSTQKPVDLFEYLIKTYTNEGDIILDNCIGSGTTAVACLKTNRQFIGFDKNPDAYEKTMKRIQEFYEQEENKK